MPITDPITKALYQRDYWAKNKEKIRARRAARNNTPEGRLKKQQVEHHSYHQGRNKRIAQQTKKNRKKGIVHRTMDGELPSIIVPPGRKWRTFENLIYFSTVKGYTEDEVLEILEAFRDMRISQEKAIEKAAKRERIKAAVAEMEVKKAARKTATKSRS